MKHLGFVALATAFIMPVSAPAAVVLTGSGIGTGFTTNTTCPGGLRACTTTTSTSPRNFTFSITLFSDMAVGETRAFQTGNQSSGGQWTGQIKYLGNTTYQGLNFEYRELTGAVLGCLTPLFQCETGQSSYSNTTGFAVSGPVVNTAVPEPSTWITMIVGFAVIGALMRRRQRQRIDSFV